MKMKKVNFYLQQNESQRIALAAAFIIIIPNFFFSDPLTRSYPNLFSEWNAPSAKHVHLLEGALLQQISDKQNSDIWSPLPHQGWKHCTHSPTVPSIPEKSRGYIQVFLDGGLNQQRMGICDAVAVAKILNATLVILHLEVNPVWQDTSPFTNIFDVDHFIEVLQDDISIVKELPSMYSWSTRDYYGTGIQPTRIKTAPVHASANWYLENVLLTLNRNGMLQALSTVVY